MRKKLALAMALSMVLTSVPVNTLTGFAEEAIVEEVVMEDYVEEAAYDAAEAPQDFDAQILDAGEVSPNGYVYKYSPETGLESYAPLGGWFTFTADEDDIYYIVLNLGLKVEFNTAIRSYYVTIPEEHYNYYVTPGSEVSLTPVYGTDADKLDYDWVYADTLEPIAEADGLSTYEIKDITENKQYLCYVNEKDGNFLTGVSFNVYVDTGFEAPAENQISIDAVIGSTITLDPAVKINDGCKLNYSWTGSTWTGGNDQPISIEDPTAEKLTVICGEEDMIYDCEVSDEYGNTAYIKFYITTAEPYIYLYHESNYDLDLGGTVTLTIDDIDTNIQSDKEITYEWYKEIYDEILDEYSRVKLENASGLSCEVSEDGTYICIVTIDEKSSEASFYVKYPDMSGTLSLEYEDYYELEIGEDVTLSVEAESTYGEISYQWYDYYGDPISDATGSSLDITAEKNGWYECKVSDKISTEWIDFYVRIDSGLTVEVVRNVTEAEEGEEVTLEVKVESKYGNAPTYEWSYYDKDEGEDVVVSTEPTFTFVLNNHVEYTCEVYDGYTREYEFFEVFVCTDLTVETPLVNTVTSAAGETVQLIVNASTRENFGPVRYEWQIWNEEDGWESFDKNENVFEVLVTEKLKQYRCIVSDAHNEERVMFYVAPESVLQGAAMTLMSMSKIRNRLWQLHVRHLVQRCMYVKSVRMKSMRSFQEQNIRRFIQQQKKRPVEQLEIKNTGHAANAASILQMQQARKRFLKMIRLFLQQERIAGQQ